MKEPIAIKRIAPPSVEDFYRDYVKPARPVVITGLIKDWPAATLWNMDYFAQNFGHVNAEVYKLKGDKCEVNTDKGSVTEPVPLRDCIASINAGKLDGGWTIASPVNLFPEVLQKDYKAPVYCADGKFLRSVAFLGPPGAVSPLHQDLPENIYVLVKGKKRITIFSPLDSVYPNSRFSKLPNHSQIDAEKPDYNLFPRLKDAQPYIVDLEAGETLFIPSLWWHHLRNLDTSIALNFWWSQGWKLPVAWAAAMYKKYRKI